MSVRSTTYPLPGFLFPMSDELRNQTFFNDRTFFHHILMFRGERQSNHNLTSHTRTVLINILRRSHFSVKKILDKFEKSCKIDERSFEFASFRIFVLHVNSATFWVYRVIAHLLHVTLVKSPIDKLKMCGIIGFSYSWEVSYVRRWLDRTNYSCGCY